MAHEKIYSFVVSFSDQHRCGDAWATVDVLALRPWLGRSCGTKAAHCALLTFCEATSVLIAALHMHLLPQKTSVAVAIAAQNKDRRIFGRRCSDLHLCYYFSVNCP